MSVNDKISSEVNTAANPMSVYKILSIEEIHNCSMILSGNDIARYLQDCTHAALLAVTLGSGVDRLIMQTEHSDMANAFLMDSFASRLAEQTMENLHQSLRTIIKDNQILIKSRFSPGFGDLPLNIHPQFLKILDAGRKIGLGFTESFLLTPRKSITAIAGIKTKDTDKGGEGN